MRQWGSKCTAVCARPKKTLTRAATISLRGWSPSMEISIALLRAFFYCSHWRPKHCASLERRASFEECRLEEWIPENSYVPLSRPKKQSVKMAPMRWRRKRVTKNRAHNRHGFRQLAHLLLLLAHLSRIFLKSQACGSSHIPRANMAAWLLMTMLLCGAQPHLPSNVSSPSLLQCANDEPSSRGVLPFRGAL